MQKNDEDAVHSWPRPEGTCELFVGLKDGGMKAIVSNVLGPLRRQSPTVDDSMADSLSKSVRLMR